MNIITVFVALFFYLRNDTIHVSLSILYQYNALYTNKGNVPHQQIRCAVDTNKLVLSHKLFQQ